MKYILFLCQMPKPVYLCSWHAEVAWRCWQRSNMYYSLYCDFIDTVSERWMLPQELRGAVLNVPLSPCQVESMIVSVCDLLVNITQSVKLQSSSLWKLVSIRSDLHTRFIFLFCLHWKQFLMCILPHPNVIEFVDHLCWGCGKVFSVPFCSGDVFPPGFVFTSHLRAFDCCVNRYLKKKNKLAWFWKVWQRNHSMCM